MALSIEEIKKAIQAPGNKQIITEAILHEDRLRFHTDTVLNENYSPMAKRKFLDWVGKLLPTDKFEYFKHLFQVPISTNELAEDIYGNLYKIFDSKNSFFDYKFKSDSAKAIWEGYVQKQWNIWKTDGWNAMQTKINSFVIVDLPQEQNGEYPKPYFYWLNIANVIDYKSRDGKTVDWIIFKNETDDKKESIAVIDDTSYRVFKYDNKVISTMPEIENPHKLGYCPAHFFWTDSINCTTPDLKKAPITNQLTDLDWLLFFSTAKKHYDLYGSYPICWGFRQKCDYTNVETNDYCDNGILRTREGTFKMTGSVIEKCPICSSNKRIGPGTFVEIDEPNPDNQQSDLRNPVGMTTVDVDALKYNVDECERLREKIYLSCVGKSIDLTKEAVNEKQVEATFESRQNVLLNLKKNFEAIIEWTYTTQCRLMFGEGFEKISINLGTEFYLLSSEELRGIYSDAKESGASDSELDNILDKVIDAEGRNNPMLSERLKIMKSIEPFRNLSKDEVVSLFKDGLISKEDAYLKIDFSNLINRFEIENDSVVIFGSKTDFNNKVSSIKEKLYEYVDEKLYGEEEEKTIDMTGVQEEIQKTALNATQISSLLSIVNQIATGMIPIEAGKLIIQASFPAIETELIDSLISKFKGFKIKNNTNINLKKGTNYGN